jgi:hypothetical protein
MKKLSAIFRIFCLVISIAASTGCRPDPEAEGQALAAQINAQSLFEVTMQNHLRAYAHIPGGPQVVLEKYAGMCSKYGIKLDTPFQQMLKQGYPELETTVQHQQLSQNADPTAKSEMLYLITFKVNATSPKGRTYLLVLQFTVFSCDEGVSVMKIGGYDELNGHKTVFRNTEQILMRIAGVRKGVNAMLKHFDETEEKK